jgi:hypothetical protein
MPCCVCSSKRFGCPTLESAIPEPDRWCLGLEGALERRGWRQWAQQYIDQERGFGGYQRWLAAKRKKLARERSTGRSE